jgi:hypothetical protein
MLGAVVMLSALVAVGVALAESSATAGDKDVHLAGPLARADGGVPGPGALSGARPAGLCQGPAPAAASAAALAYVAATNAVIPQWNAVSVAIGQNGGKARPQDFVTEENADSQLLGRLGGIKFSGNAASLAADFESYVRSYVLKLQLVLRQGPTASAMTTLGQLDRQRTAASSRLRAALGLSPSFPCQWLRPGAAPMVAVSAGRDANAP